MPVKIERSARPVGGWRGSESSLAQLVQYRAGPAPVRRRCAECKRTALKGSGVCRVHAGLPSTRDRPRDKARRLLAGLERLGLVPMALQALPVWRALERVSPLDRVAHRLALLDRWHGRNADPLVWARVWRAAVAATGARR